MSCSQSRHATYSYMFFFPFLLGISLDLILLSRLFLTFCQRDLFCYPPEQLSHRYLFLYEHPQSTLRCSRMTAYLYIEKKRKTKT